MRISDRELNDVVRYIENHKHIKVADKLGEFEDLMSRIRPFKEIGPDTRILEIGTGTGWLPTLCKMKGLQCRGLEISPQLVEYGRELGRENNVETDIELGNIEDCDVGESVYDVILALSVFEHVEHWQEGLRKIYRALKPGGVFYFISTNKFSPKSGEYSFPLYGWMPNFMRYRLRIMCQGPDIMELGIDFHQYTYPQLRRFFTGLGYTQVFDRIDIVQASGFRKSSGKKQLLLKAARRSRLLRNLVLLPVSTTNFICLK